MSGPDPQEFTSKSTLYEYSSGVENIMLIKYSSNGKGIVLPDNYEMTDTPRTAW